MLKTLIILTIFYSTCAFSANKWCEIEKKNLFKNCARMNEKILDLLTSTDQAIAAEKNGQYTFQDLKYSGFDLMQKSQMLNLDCLKKYLLDLEKCGQPYSKFYRENAPMLPQIDAEINRLKMSLKK